MEKYKIKSKINIFSKIIDTFFIIFSFMLTFYAVKTGVAFSSLKNAVFIILLAVYFGYIFIRDFICYKILKITYHELIFFYPILRQTITVKKSDIEKAEFLETEHFYKLNIFYHRIKIVVKEKNYIISSKDYRNFWEILEKIGSKLPKRKIENYKTYY